MQWTSVSLQWLQFAVQLSIHKHLSIFVAAKFLATWFYKDRHITSAVACPLPVQQAVHVHLHIRKVQDAHSHAIASVYAGALKTLGANKDLALPIKLFESSDVVFLEPNKEVGSKNQRQLVAVHCSKESGFEVIHGLLNRVMEVLGIPLRQGQEKHVTINIAWHCFGVI